MERLEHNQAKMRKDVNLMKVKVDHILKYVTTMMRIEEELRQDDAIRNAILIHVFFSSTQPTLINPLHGVPSGYCTQLVIPRPPNQQTFHVP